MSTIVAMKKALVDVVASAPAFSGVQVTYGEVVNNPRRERFYLGDVEDHEMTPATMRAAKVRTEEDYTLKVLLSVDGNASQEVTETRALVLLGALEDLLAGDPKLSAASTPPGILWATPSGFTLSSSLVAEKTHRTLIEADVAVRARNS